ncbi:hypothetical protein PMAYCL1PPCAC_01505, partial [Pristionchus mayeri]
VAGDSEEVIDPKEEPIHELPNDEQNFGMDLMSDEMTYKDVPLQEGDEFNDKREHYSMADRLVENRGGEEEPLHNTENVVKESSGNVVVEKRRRSSRNMSGNLNCTEPMEASDEEGGRTVKKGRSDLVERREK